MQIHELTKLQKQLEEGLLDGVKAAVRTAKAGYKAGGIGGVASTLTDPRAFARQQNAVYKKKNSADVKALADKMNKGKQPGSKGYWYPPGSPEYKAQQASKAVANNPQAQQKINNLTAQFQDTFGVYDSVTGQHSQEDTVLPEPNQTLMVTAKNGGKYYKAINGNWYSETGEVVPDPAGLEKMVSADQYKQVGVPGVIQTKLKVTAPEIKPTNAVKSNATVNEVSSKRRRQQRLAAGVTQPNSTTKKLPLSDFGKWAEKNVPGIDTALENPTAKAEIQSLSNQIKTAADVETATPLFKKLATTVVSAANGQDSQSFGGPANTGAALPTKDFIDIIKQSGLNGLTNALRNDPPRQKTGSKTLDNALHDARLLEEKLKKELDNFKESSKESNFKDILAFARKNNIISISQLQRHFDIGYNVAADIIKITREETPELVAQQQQEKAKIEAENELLYQIYYEMQALDHGEYNHIPSYHGGGWFSYEVNADSIRQALEFGPFGIEADTNTIKQLANKINFKDQDLAEKYKRWRNQPDVVNAINFWHGRREREKQASRDEYTKELQLKQLAQQEQNAWRYK